MKQPHLPWQQHHLPLSLSTAGGPGVEARCSPSATGTAPPSLPPPHLFHGHRFVMQCSSRPAGESTSFTPHVVRGAVPSHFKWSDAPVHSASMPIFTLTHPTSHLTPHTSHLTPHTSHLTPHTSGALAAEAQLQQQLRALGHRRPVQHLGWHANIQRAVVRRAGKRVLCPANFNLKPCLGSSSGRLSRAVSAISILQ